jgi:hypothetical protein
LSNNAQCAWLSECLPGPSPISAVKVAGGASNPVHFKDDATAEELRAEIERRLNILQEAGILELKVIEPEVQ